MLGNGKIRGIRLYPLPVVAPNLVVAPCNRLNLAGDSVLG